MYTIGQLAKEFNLSRSTLLYYDKLGLLPPTSRTQSNYRLYNEKAHQKLKQIISYREAGLSLNRITELLKNDSKSKRTSILENQLHTLNEQIAELRNKQHTILAMLDNPDLTHASRSMNKQQWVELLRATGLSDEDMAQWHIEFERNMPEAHEDFLHSLNIPKHEIQEIRKWSRKGIKQQDNK